MYYCNNAHKNKLFSWFLFENNLLQIFTTKFPENNNKRQNNASYYKYCVKNEQAGILVHIYIKKLIISQFLIITPTRKNQNHIWKSFSLISFCVGLRCDATSLFIVWGITVFPRERKLFLHVVSS